MKPTRKQTELAQKILSTSDKKVLKYIEALFDNDINRWEEEMPEYIRKSVERGLADADAGRVTSHKEVQKKYRKWLKK